MTSPRSSESPADGAERRVRKVVTDRSGGVSEGPYGSFNLGDHVGDDPTAVAANRTRLAGLLGLPEDRMVYMEQVHSPTVTEVTPELLDGLAGGPVPVTDALVTTLRGTALVVLTADCVPVLLSDEDAGVVAAVHAGRLGARNGILARTLDEMERLGAVPARVHVLFGAAIAGTDYEIPESMARDVEERLPGSRTRTSTGTTGLDLRAGLLRQLMERGVTMIDADPRSTLAEESLFSYRRDGTTGRQAAVVWMP